VIGFAGGRVQQIPANILLVKDVTVFGFNFGRYMSAGRNDERERHEPEVRGAMEQIFKWYAQGKLRPITSHCFPLRDYRAAMETVLNRKSMGKVVLEMPIARG
jgi:NADPH2:quinone reductase